MLDGRVGEVVGMVDGVNREDGVEGIGGWGIGGVGIKGVDERGDIVGWENVVDGGEENVFWGVRGVSGELSMGEGELMGDDVGVGWGGDEYDDVI